MTSKLITVPAILTRASTLADGGLSLGFHTNELTAEQKVEVMQFSGEFGYLMFKSNEFNQADIPRDNAPVEGKSKSQVLRGSLYVLWKAQGSEGDFEIWYRRQMDRFIENVKFQIEEKQSKSTYERT